MKNIHEDCVYYCRECDQMNLEKDCHHCGKDGAPIPRNTADKHVWDENFKRMNEWCQRGRVLPEVE